MLFRVGFDVRYHDSWYAYNYMPLTGQFFVQRQAPVPAYPLVDVFASFRVQTLRVFFKMENIYSYLNQKGQAKADAVDYETYHYPVPGPIFRFGLKWRLAN